MHYYKFEISVWNLHTAHLTLVEEAVYRRLIDHYYDTEEPIARDFNGMIRRLRLENYREEVITILNEFFQEVDNGYRNKHCDQKILDYKKQKKTNKINGKSGGRPKKQIVTESVADGMPLVTLTTNNKQEIKNKKQTLELPDWLPETHWNDFVEFRKFIKKPMTDRAKQLMLSNLQKIKDNGHDPILAINKSIANNWSDIYEPKPNILNVINKPTFDGRLRGAK
jgi:uncharacterized protein YdaU (DUF1376 family)